VADHSLTQPAAEAEHAHEGVPDPDPHHSPEEIKREIRVYLIIFGALAALTAHHPDNTRRKRASVALQPTLSQGRAPGVCVIGQLQDPRKQIIDFRHLFPVKIAMRLDEPEQVDMVLGDGVRQRGAAAHEISEDTPGVAWAKIDGRRDPDRARAFHTIDADLDELSDYVIAGRYDVPRSLTGIEAA